MHPIYKAFILTCATMGAAFAARAQAPSVQERREMGAKLFDGGRVPSIAEQMGVESLGIPSESEVFSFFGAYRDKQGGKIVFRTLDNRPKRYLLYNLSPIMEASERPAFVEKLLSSSPCGRRGFEAIVSYKAPDASREERGFLTRAGLLWDCSNRCFAVIERVKVGGPTATPNTVALSPTVGIPQEFCSGVWGGIIRIEDRLESENID